MSISIITALLASCNVNVDVVDENERGKADSLSVGFGVYVNRGVSTKAGKTGDMTTTSLQEADAGFGVFSYYGNGALYNETSKPDFMYNEKVTYDSQYGKWDYHPVKYWPNEFGAAASSEAADRLTFFAYAPYVEVTPTTGIVTASGDSATTGIIGLSRNIAAGDPKVMYSANLMPGAGVDLCWGVAADTFISSVDGNNNHVEKGHPFLNVIKPKTGDRLTFNFHHALAQLNVQVDADVDVESHATSEVAMGTRIYVRSVTFSGFTTRGSLNLNSVADGTAGSGPVWNDISGTGRLKRDPVTVYDGRTDGLEAMAEDMNEVPTGLNPTIIQNGTSEGVTNTTVNLFNSTEAEAPVLVIPTSGVPVKVTIVYDIETADPSLPGYLSDGTTHGISVENTITKTVQLTGGGNMTLEAGKKYVIGLHLGLTSVKFDAKVSDWDNESYANTDLPVNTSSIGSVTLSSETATVWRNESVTKPTVTAVTGSDGTDLTSLATIAWSSSDASVAAVDATTGDITLTGVAGSADIVATATYEGSSQTAVFKLYVNEVTGITISPSTTEIASEGRTKVLTATLAHTSNGTIASWPTMSWATDNTAHVTVSPTSSDVSLVGTVAKTAITITGVGAGDAVITASVDDSYTTSSVSGTSTVSCITVPAGTSGGAFSVSATKKVYIATSNLMWEGTTESGAYSLMEHPWTIIEEAGSTIPADYGISATNSVQVGYFGWGTPSKPYWTTNNNSSYASGGFVDWGTMYGDGQWHCLSYNEWNYVRQRSSGSLWGVATVNNVRGVVMAPDDFVTPLDASFVSGCSNGWDTNTYTSAQWDVMEKAGAVFVPAAGHRDVFDGNIIKDVGYEVWFVTTTPYTQVAGLSYNLNVKATGWGAAANRYYMGAPVRLVYDKQ